MQHGSTASHTSTLPLKAAGVGAAIVAAPYILPFLGIGNAAANSLPITAQLTALCETSAGYGTGLAGLLNGTFSHIPVVGHTLAAGGLASAAMAGVVGVGGMLLGNYLERFDRPGEVAWGKIIKYAALATSILVALPSILSGLTMGLTFLAFTAGGAAFASSVVGMLAPSLGLMGNISLATAGAGLSGLLPHALTCGAALLPVGISTAIQPQSAKVQQPQWQARLAPLPPLAVSSH